MKILVSFLLFISNTIFLLSQKEMQSLYFGNTILNFHDFSFDVVSTSVPKYTECGASICDSLGNLLFFSNGGTSPTNLSFQGGVFQADGQFMQNGLFINSTGCTSSFSGAVIVPSPSTSKQYHLLARDCIESSFSGNQSNSGLSYALIDMNANAGNGAVISQNNSIVSSELETTSSQEPLAIVLATSNLKVEQTAYWIFSYKNDSLYHLFFDASGFSLFKMLDQGRGYIVVSPDRKHILVGNKLYALNSESGEISLRSTLNFDGISAAFSPNGKVLYIVSSNTIKQYDLNEEQFLDSEQTICNTQLQTKIFLSPAGTILIFEASKTYISGQISCPNSLGSSCQYNSSSISLEGGSCPLAPPNIPSHYLYSESLSCELSVKNEQIQSIYPNPTSDKIYVEDYFSGLQFTVFSLEGKCVQNGKVSSNGEIQLSLLEEGFYYLYLGNLCYKFHFFHK
jgi:hypothetical protein